MIHWFNPLMWLAYVLLCRDIELACDERVIKELGNEQRADYTQALVVCSVNRRMIAACPLAFGEVGVKDRVKSVMNYKKPAFWIIILAVIACVTYEMGNGIAKGGDKMSLLIMAGAFVAACFMNVNVIYIILTCIIFGVVRTLLKRRKEA